MKPVHYAKEAIGSLDELIGEHVIRLSEKLASPHSLEELEAEITILNELVKSFKFRDELLKRLADDNVPDVRRKQVREALAEHNKIIRHNRQRSQELISKSHQLIEKSGRLFEKLAIERPLLDSPPSNHRNLLLAALPGSQYTGLIPKLERVSLSLSRIVCRPDEPIRYVYFPETAIFSVIATMKNGACVEVGTVGNEGVIGVRVLAGAVATPGETVVQVAGTALRMRTDALLDEIHSGSRLQRLLLIYSQAALTQARQSAACKNFHSVEKRLARWLLTISDYRKSYELVLTQSQIAQVIGSRIAGVSEAASKLQKSGLIRYSRGHIQILDRQALMAAACECYRVMRKELDKLYKDYIRIAQENAFS